MSTLPPVGTTQPLPDTRTYRAMKAGHLARAGHELDAVLVHDGDGTWSIRRNCCDGEAR